MPDPKKSTMNTLPNSFYTMPQTARTTLPYNELLAIMLDNNGWIIACGRPWNIRNRLLGAGVYDVWLEARNA